MKVTGGSSSRWALMQRLVIGPPDSPYLTRLRIVSTPLFGVYLHRLHRPDAERDLHDHPWAFATLVIRGSYMEEFHPDPRQPTARVGRGQIRRAWRRWSIHRMPLGVAHRIIAVGNDATTLLLVGPKVRQWGFWTRDGWVPWDCYEYATSLADADRATQG